MQALLAGELPEAIGSAGRRPSKVVIAICGAIIGHCINSVLNSL